MRGMRPQVDALARRSGSTTPAGDVLAANRAARTLWADDPELRIVTFAPEPPDRDRIVALLGQHRP